MIVMTIHIFFCFQHKGILYIHFINWIDLEYLEYLEKKNVEEKNIVVQLHVYLTERNNIEEKSLWSCRMLRMRIVIKQTCLMTFYLFTRTKYYRLSLSFLFVSFRPYLLSSPSDHRISFVIHNVLLLPSFSFLSISLYYFFPLIYRKKKKYISIYIRTFCVTHFY